MVRSASPCPPDVGALGKLSLAFRGAPNALEYALDQALLIRAAKEEREAILRVAKDVFEDQWR